MAPAAGTPQPSRPTSEEQPRLLFVATEFPFPARNGVTNKCANLIQRLTAHYRVTLVSFVFGGRPGDAALESARRFCEEVHLLEPRERNVAAAVLRLEPPFVTRFRTPEALALIAELTRSRAYDVVHLDTVSAVPLRAAVHGRPLVVASINDSYTLMLRDRPAANLAHGVAWRVTSRLVARLERRWFPRCDQVHVVSVVDRQFLADLTPEASVHVVPLGVDASRFEGFETLEEPDTIVFCAEMAGTGGHGDTIVRFARTVMPLIWKGAPRVRLLVVGRNPPERLLAMAADEPRLVVTGEVPDVRPYVARGTIALSLNPLIGGQHTKVLEALALARPVVGFAHNFVPFEGARDGEHYVAATSPQELADAVLGLLADPERRRALGAAGREFASRCYTWERTEQRYLSLVGHPAGRSE